MKQLRFLTTSSVLLSKVCQIKHCLLNQFQFLILVLPLASCMILVKLVNLSEVQFVYISNGDSILPQGCSDGQICVKSVSHYKQLENGSYQYLRSQAREEYLYADLIWNSVFSFLRNTQTVYQSNNTILHSQKKYMKV